MGNTLGRVGSAEPRHPDVQQNDLGLVQNRQIDRLVSAQCDMVRPLTEEKNLDLVVSVQTAVVHLAGALGVPALVMIPAVAEWRYGASGGAMPWYGSVELLRQGGDGSWGPIIAQIVARLRDRA